MLRAASRRVTRIYDRALAPTRLGLNQYAILSRLERLGQMGLHALADRLVMDRSTLGRLLRPLEARGLVTLDVDAQDRRGRSIALTPAGRALVLEARVLWAEAEAAFRMAYGPGEATALHAMLRRVLAADLSPAAP